MHGEPTKNQKRKYYAIKVAWSKQDMEYYNKRVYYHMKLQSEGVKYKPKSSDTTYHGRKAIHNLMAYKLSQEIYFRSLEMLEKLYK